MTMPRASTAAQLGQLGHGDAADLPGEHGADERDVGPEAKGRTQTGFVTDGQHEERAEDEHPRDGDDRGALQQGLSALRAVEVGEAERRRGRALRPAGPPRTGRRSVRRVLDLPGRHGPRRYEVSSECASRRAPGTLVRLLGSQVSPRTMATIFSPHSVGFCATATPAADSASILAWAVPWEPEMMAPAWPILRPGGAVTPAM